MASNKMTNCKACGAEIAKNAKTCPHCGAKNKKKHLVLWIILAVLALIIIFSIAAGNNENSEGNPVNSNSSVGQISSGESEKNTETEKTTFGVGEKAEQKNIAVTLVKVEENNGSQFNKPQDGNVFVLCEFEIENNSKSEITVSSIVSFEAYCDDYALNFSLSSLLEKGNKNQLDGQIAAGKKMNGVIGYEVPEDWKELEIRFTPGFWSGKEITFVTNH